MVVISIPGNLTLGSKIVVDLHYDVHDDDGDFYFRLQGKKSINSSFYSIISSVDLDKTKLKSKKKFDIAKNSSDAM